MIQVFYRAYIKRQCLCSFLQGKELCSLRSWRWISILTVTEPASTTLPFLMMSSAPCFWMKQTAAMWLALFSQRRLDCINFLPRYASQQDLYFSSMSCWCNYFPVLVSQEKEVISEEYAYTVYSIDNILSAFSLSWLSSMNHRFVLTKYLVYWI